MDKRNFKRAAVLGSLLSMLLVPSAFAAGTMPIDLQTALDKAFATHPNIKIAEYNLENAKESLKAANGAYGPSVSLTQSTGRGGYRDDQFQNGVNVGKNIGNAYNSGLTVSVPLYTGGSLEGTYDKAKLNYNSYIINEVKAYNDLKKTTTDAYFKLLSAKDGVRVGQESVATLQDHLKNVNAQFEVGVVAKVDVLRSEVELTNAQQSLIKAQNAYDLAEASLDNIIGVSHDTKLQPKETLQYKPYNNALEPCIEYALANRPDLKLSKNKVEAAKADLSIAKAGYRPTVAATASNKWSQGSWPGSDNENWAVGVNVNMNVFDSGVTKSKVAAAKATLNAQEALYSQDMDTVRLDVRSCYYDMREAEKRISTTQVAVAKAEEDYHIAQVRYQAGVGTNTDVLDAEVALRTAKNNFNTALYDYNTSNTALQTAMGIEAKPNATAVANAGKVLNKDGKPEKATEKITAKTKAETKAATDAKATVKKY